MAEQCSGHTESRRGRGRKDPSMRQLAARFAFSIGFMIAACAALNALF
jgi:hypothetical protein